MKVGRPSAGLGAGERQHWVGEVLQSGEEGGSGPGEGHGVQA